jgi:hypothetical protein
VTHIGGQEYWNRPEGGITHLHFIPAPSPPFCPGYSRVVAPFHHSTLYTPRIHPTRIPLGRATTVIICLPTYHLPVDSPKEPVWALVIPKGFTTSTNSVGIFPTSGTSTLCSAVRHPGLPIFQAFSGAGSGPLVRRD